MLFGPFVMRRRSVVAQTIQAERINLSKYDRASSAGQQEQQVKQIRRSSERYWRLVW